MFHLLLGRLPTPHAFIRRDWLDALIGGSFSLANSAMNNEWSLENAIELADHNKNIAKELGEFNLALGKKGLDYSIDKNLIANSLSNIQTPSSRRTGLELAGYNPILAVNSAAGQSFGNSISAAASGAGGSSASPMQSNVLGAIAAVSAIRQNDARTDLIKAQTENTGWVVKTLSRSEAQGLGTSVLGALGINLHESDQQTFLIAYNTRTGELRNLGNTKDGLGSIEPSSAVDVIPVDWKTDKSPSYRFNPDDWELKPEYRK